MPSLSQEQIAQRVAEAATLQARERSSSGLNSKEQGARIYAYLKEHGSIKSNDPLLAELNAKAPTDAVWTNCALGMREQLAVDG
jgi:hypothetical protein